MHFSRKNLWRMNGLKTKSYLQQITQPSPSLLPLGPSEVKWLAHKCVRTSFIFYYLFIYFLFFYFIFIFYFIASKTHTEKKQKLHRINKVIKTKKTKKQIANLHTYMAIYLQVLKYVTAVLIPYITVLIMIYN